MPLRFSRYNISDCFGHWKKCHVIEIDVQKVDILDNRVKRGKI